MRPHLFVPGLANRGAESGAELESESSRSSEPELMSESEHPHHDSAPLLVNIVMSAVLCGT